MAVYRYSTYRYWKRRGFLDEEIEYLTRLSPAGRKAPHWQKMIRDRISLKANKVKYEWSEDKYINRVLVDYERKLGRAGEIKIGESLEHFMYRVFYGYMDWYKDHTPKDPTWVTPKHKKRVVGEPKRQATKRKMLHSQIDDKNQDIIRAIGAGDQRRRRELERQRNELQRELDFLG